MGQPGRALEALLSPKGGNHSSPDKEQSEKKHTKAAEPEYLSGMELVYAAYSEEGTPLVGSPSAGFAYFAEKSDTLVVVSADSRKVQHVSMESAMATHAMEVAQGLGASFMTFGNQVVCNIKGVSQAGSNYAEAAMRAILAFIRLENSMRDDEADSGGNWSA